MRDILIGLLIILVIFIGGDYIYSNKNTCLVSYGEVKKCGFIKKTLDIDIELFDRYW